MNLLHTCISLFQKGIPINVKWYKQFPSNCSLSLDVFLKICRSKWLAYQLALIISDNKPIHYLLKYILYSKKQKLDQNSTPHPSNQKTWIRSWFPIHSASLTYVLLVVNAFNINILYQFNTQTVLKGTTKTWKWQKSSAPPPNLDPLWK